jgi:hypothetical protein
VSRPRSRGASKNKKEKSIVFKRLIVAISFVALAAATSWAQDQRVEIGGSAGWTLSDGVTGQTIIAADGNAYNSIEPKDSFSYALDIGYFLNDTWEIGALFSQQKSKLVVGGGIEREVGDWSVNNYHGTFTYNSGDADSGARFYFLGGAGVTQYGSVDFTGVGGDAREIGGETKFSTTWGAGVKIYPGRSAGLKLGVRWTPTYIKSDAVGWWCDPYWGCYTVGDAQYSNQFEFSGGVTFRF